MTTVGVFFVYFSLFGFVLCSIGFVLIIIMDLEGIMILGTVSEVHETQGSNIVRRNTFFMASLVPLQKDCVWGFGMTILMF